ncbi:hypothetical protein OGAPHI_002146 [Ogataea philodendri]|uniref:Uncharacterized protein n=1 Tax=Ogataea philodendri TaxID=1378263 RepID=A0A9P8PAN9_9ASCO|nr:uncharacterized protein OGAPHI_002146 [Ogataea philodendri]KAH3668392.1 hypothetical protein OGAPHI_002146 [Ogataea philodendri]
MEHERTALAGAASESQSSSSDILSEISVPSLSMIESSPETSNNTWSCILKLTAARLIAMYPTKSGFGVLKLASDFSSSFKNRLAAPLLPSNTLNKHLNKVFSSNRLGDSLERPNNWNLGRLKCNDRWNAQFRVGKAKIDHEFQESDCPQRMVRLVNKTVLQNMVEVSLDKRRADSIVDVLCGLSMEHLDVQFGCLGVFEVQTVFQQRLTVLQLQERGQSVDDYVLEIEVVGFKDRVHYAQNALAHKVAWVGDAHVEQVLDGHSLRPHVQLVVAEHGDVSDDEPRDRVCVFEAEFRRSKQGGVAVEMRVSA